MGGISTTEIPTRKSDTIAPNKILLILELKNEGLGSGIGGGISSEVSIPAVSIMVISLTTGVGIGVDWSPRISLSLSRMH